MLHDVLNRDPENVCVQSPHAWPIEDDQLELIDEGSGAIRAFLLQRYDRAF